MNHQSCPSASNKRVAPSVASLITLTISDPNTGFSNVQTLSADGAVTFSDFQSGVYQITVQQDKQIPQTFSVDISNTQQNIVTLVEKGNALPVIKY